MSKRRRSSSSAEHGRLPLLVAHVYIKGSRWDLPGLAGLNAEIEELVRATAGWPRSDADTFLKAAADVHRAGTAFWQGKPKEAVRIASEVLGGALTRSRERQPTCGRTSSTTRRAEARASSASACR